MSVSNEQVVQELHSLIASHPALQPLRVCLRKLPYEDRDQAEHALVSFLMSDAVFDAAMLHVTEAPGAPGQL